MKKQQEKSIEEIALEDYAWKIGTARLLKAEKLFSSIFTIVVVFIVLFYPSPHLGVRVFISLFVGITSWMLFKIVFLISTEFYFRGNRRKKLIITSLSDEFKKTIIKVFIQRQINQAEQNIAYCNRQFEPYRKSIHYSEGQIKEFEEKLTTM